MRLSEILDHNLTPQAQRVLDHLQTKGSITNVEAHSVHRVRSLSRRMTEIADALAIGRLTDSRVAPYRIDKEFRKDVTGQRYVRYSLVRQ